MRKKSVIITLLDNSFDPTAEETSYLDSSYAGTPQQHNVRPTVAARQPQIGRMRHALTHALTARHAIARVTTTPPHDMPHITVRTVSRTHTQRPISLPYAVVEARASHERLEVPVALEAVQSRRVTYVNLRFRVRVRIELRRVLSGCRVCGMTQGMV